MRRRLAALAMVEYPGRAVEPARNCVHHRLPTQ